MSLTPKQIKFIGAVASGKTATQAAIESYDTDSLDVASTIGCQNMAKPSIREAIEAELQKQGISLELAVAPVKKALLAKKAAYKIDPETGKKISVGEVDDIELQLQGHDRAMKLMGANRPDISLGNLFMNGDINIGKEFVK